jgi:hypothetical protein
LLKVFLDNIEVKITAGYIGNFIIYRSPQDRKKSLLICLKSFMRNQRFYLLGNINGLKGIPGGRYIKIEEGISN